MTLTSEQSAEIISPTARAIEQLELRRPTAKHSGGISFAREQNRQQKDAARQQILDLFSPDQWPNALHTQL